ncbi:MAG: hypothetical protein FWC16_00605 [Defluviitaleaceae bacterium]|nr:hypothetical protein [Defluviitaleaceae bacterium]MCL2273404.1 hypothetical protein [Defluviitaleaceae bacterium]
MEFANILTAIEENGLTLVLLVVFIILYVQQSRRQETLYVELKENFKERVDTIIADGVRREELVRNETAKREALIREDSSRRDRMFTDSLEKHAASMDKMAVCMDEIKTAFMQMDFQVKGIGKAVERLEQSG